MDNRDITEEQARKINYYRLFLKVTTLVDITTLDGERIVPNMAAAPNGMVGVGGGCCAIVCLCVRVRARVYLDVLFDCIARDSDFVACKRLAGFRSRVRCSSILWRSSRR